MQHGGGFFVGARMDKDNLEIVVMPGNWQTAGMPPRWNWASPSEASGKVVGQGHCFWISEKSPRCRLGCQRENLDEGHGKYRSDLR
jgi:hypothetical protein